MTQQNNRSILQATYTVETSKEKKTELWSAAVSWTGAGKKYVDVVAKKGKLTIKNPKATSIKCKVQHALQVNFFLVPRNYQRFETPLHDECAFALKAL